MSDVLIEALARPDDDAARLADIICLLAVRGGELGELEMYGAAEGQPQPFKRLRGEWLERLAVAVERGSLARMAPERVVEILLLGRP
ncbi:hypothetical protein BRADO3619 [Bradyrhizobium sp. ORS 278]|uniref:hypothetical protein n=1 Tax=Bradyrhizobium sp. (strain ORS 278) TaxID=114615 RepID=UPI0001508E4F|nr:hypothetical protein [Bradyrhizobium sp. ORS 278]CAL77396.1 hypothetical protein BRADO3619 [Bradyrhizobium sp. ORS 278]